MLRHLSDYCVIAVTNEMIPARDSDHCDYPDCEQHWSVFASLLCKLLVESRPYIVRADEDGQAESLLHRIDVAIKLVPQQPTPWDQ